VVVAGRENVHGTGEGVGRERDFDLISRGGRGLTARRLAAVLEGMTQIGVLAGNPPASRTPEAA
jgi:hypothetical protein